MLLLRYTLVSIKLCNYAESNAVAVISTFTTLVMTFILLIPKRLLKYQLVVQDTFRHFVLKPCLVVRIVGVKFGGEWFDGIFRSRRLYPDPTESSQILTHSFIIFIRKSCFNQRRMFKLNCVGYDAATDDTGA